MNDQLLWRSFLNGDKASFEAIYSSYYKSLHSYGMRKVNSATIVNDCIQELFINLWVKRANLGDTDNIKYYLLASLRNMLIKVSAEDNKWQKTELLSIDNFQIEFNPESEYIQKENLSNKAKILIEALDKLTPRQKEVLYLRFFEELSYEQIAELLDLTVRGVYKLNYRAIDALKTVLDISRADLLIVLALCRLELFK